MMDWPVILIASVAPIVSAFGAIWIKGGIDRRSRIEERQWAAYEKMAGASEIIAMRSAVYNAQRGPLHAAADSLNAMTKFVMVLFLSILRPFRQDREHLRMLVDSLPIPSEPHPVMEASELLQAMDELIRARVEVHLVGSNAAIEAADELLDRSKVFLAIMESQQTSLRNWNPRSLLAESEREEMLAAHRRFVTTIRRESKRPVQAPP